MASTELVQHRRDVVGEAIAERVIGHHPLDAADSVIGKKLGGPLQECRAGAALLVREDLGIGQPGVIIDQGMHEVETDPGALLR